MNTLLSVERAVLCGPQSAASLVLSKIGAHGATRPTCLALLAAAAFVTHVTFAGKPTPPPPPPPPSSGSLVLDYAGPDGSGASSWGLVVAPSGTIYAVGNDYALDPDWGQLVLGSSDNGNNWSVLDDYAPPGREVELGGVLGGGIASDSVGNLYVSSFNYDNASYGRAGWYVRRSVDDGLTWATVVDFAVAPVLTYADDVAVAADGAGDVYVAACDVYVLNSVWYHDWTIRKGIGGTSFSTIEVLPNSFPKDIFVHPTAGVFVVGSTQAAQKGGTVGIWFVRRSTDAGASWSTVDTFQLASGYRSVAMGVAANSTGIYVVGSASASYKSGAPSHWIVRKSTNGGNSWTTVDDYQLAAGNSSEARCIATDANGNLWVAGRGNAGQGNRWIVRKSVGGAGLWTTVDVFDAGVDANAIASSPSGNVFVGGTGGGNWLLKKY
jgi:hypothetical protein